MNVLKLTFHTTGYILAILLSILLILFLPIPAIAQQNSIIWDEVKNLSESETSSNDPSLTSDTSGDVHVVWSEETWDDSSFITYTHLHNGVWSEPNEIIADPLNQTAMYPSIGSDSLGYLHLVWRGASISYSNAYAPLAYSSQNWAPPKLLEYVQNYIGHPQLVVSNQDILHVIYDIGTGENSGIYYVHSLDRGLNWIDPVIVYQNLRADRIISGPRMAVDFNGNIHVVWVEAKYPESFPPIGVFYANSTDNGITWSDPYQIANGTYGDPGIGTRLEEVHISWSGTGDHRYKFHSWSTDGGKTWSDTDQNSNLGGFQGFPAIVSDSEHFLHRLMIGSIFNIETENAYLKDSLYYDQWNGDGWSAGQILDRNTSTKNNPRDVSATISLGNQLNVVWTNSLDSSVHPDGWQTDIYYINGSVPAKSIDPSPLPKPNATQTIAGEIEKNQENPTSPNPTMINTISQQPGDGSLLKILLISSIAAAVIIFTGILISFRLRK